MQSKYLPSTHPFFFTTTTNLLSLAYLYEGCGTGNVFDVHMCLNMDTRMSFKIYFPPYSFLEAYFFAKPKFLCFPRLPDQWTPGICLSPSPQCWGYRYVPYTLLLRRYLESQLRFPCLYNKYSHWTMAQPKLTFYPTNNGIQKQTHI